MILNHFTCIVFVFVCVGHLAGGIGLAIPIEVVSEPFGKWYQHDLNRQTKGRRLGQRCS